jgi:hypothetical protein
MDVAAVLKVLATAIAASGRNVRAATLCVSHHLVGLVAKGIASDIGELKADHLTRSRAAAALDQAKALEALAKGAEAANAEIQARHMREAALEQERAKARIATAQADVVEAAATVVKNALLSGDPAALEASARLEAAVRRLNLKGGRMFVPVNELPSGEAAAETVIESSPRKPEV